MCRTVPPPGRSAAELASLDAADLKMIGTQSENGSLARLAEFRDVIGFPVHDHPAHAGGYSRTGDLWKCRATGGLEHNGIGPLFGSSLNGLQNLRALIDGVVVRINNFRFDTELAGHLYGGTCLFNLVIIVVGQQRHKDAQSFHSLASGEK